MEVTILSRNTIKPSSPTPSILQTFQLQCLEKFSPLVYTPLLFFYPNKNNQEPEDSSIARLINSLSEALNPFFFLEGEFDGGSIHCSYEEVTFVKARVSGGMSEILKEPNNEAALMKLIMYSTFWTDPLEKYARIAVQANVFDCGGVAIALSLLHELMDATALSRFLKSWVDINVKSFDSIPSIACSDFGPLSSLFDPRSHDVVAFQRLELKDDAIPILKGRAESIDVPNPTCVEVVAGWIWKCALEVVLLRSASSVLTRAVNLHKKMQADSSSSARGLFSVGNFWWIEVARCVANGRSRVELSELVGLLRELFGEINGDYWMKSSVISKLLSAEIIPKVFMCTNWESIDLSNEIDFGWENAIWIGALADSNATSSKNIGILLRAVSDDEIEIWIVLDEEEIELFVENREFRNFVDLTVL